MKKYLIEAIEREKTALDALSAMSLQECERVMAAIEECKGKVVFCGVGKSAHIGAKLAQHLLRLVYLHSLFMLQRVFMGILE